MKKNLCSGTYHSPLRVNNHLPYHAQIIMKSTDVVEGTRRCEGHPEPRHAQRRLRKCAPVLGCRTQTPRVRVETGRRAAISGDLL